MITNKRFYDTLKSHRAITKNQINDRYFRLLDTKQYNELTEFIEDYARFWGFEKVSNHKAVSSCGMVKYLDYETYDKKGNLIPLSDRFDHDIKDPNF